jgi:ElaA protein
LKNSLIWTCKAFNDLSGFEVYQILAARAAVFVVEQNCVYDDADFSDAHCHHLIAWRADTDASKQLAAYARLVPPGLKYSEAAIGRVITSATVRRQKLGAELMQRAIASCNERFGEGPIRISAQLYLLAFYTRLGFVQDSEIYPEDGIPHVQMLRPALPVRIP